MKQQSTFSPPQTGMFALVECTCICCLNNRIWSEYGKNNVYNIRTRIQCCIKNVGKKTPNLIILNLTSKWIQKLNWIDQQLNRQAIDICETTSQPHHSNHNDSASRLLYTHTTYILPCHFYQQNVYQQCSPAHTKKLSVYACMCIRPIGIHSRITRRRIQGIHHKLSFAWHDCSNSLKCWFYMLLYPAHEYIQMSVICNSSVVSCGRYFIVL